MKILPQSRLLKEEHLKLSLMQEEYPEIIVDAIGFKMGEKWNEINPEMHPHKKFDVVYSLEENHWQGNSNLQLVVRDIKISKS